MRTYIYYNCETGNIIQLAGSTHISRFRDVEGTPTHLNELNLRMRTKRLSFALLSLVSCLGFVLWTFYQEGRTQTVEDAHLINPNQRPRVALKSSQNYHDFQWPLVHHRFLPNYFLMWDRPEMAASLLAYRDSNIVFLHHNKAGGMSIRKCLMEIGKKSGLEVAEQVISYRYVVQEFDYWKHAPRTKKHVGLYGGYSFGVCDIMRDGRPCSYFTMIRNPYDRAISAYLYCKKYTSHDQLCTALKASEVSVVDWALHHGSYFFGQLLMNPAVCNGSYDESEYLRDISDVPHKFSSDLVPCWFKNKLLLERMFSEEERERMLQHMLSNLENYFAVIGLLEHFDLSLAMYQHVYHIPFRDKCTSTHSNKGRYHRAKQQLYDDPEKLVRGLKQELLSDPRVNASLRADLLLYERAKVIFEKQNQTFSHIRGQ